MIIVNISIMEGEMRKNIFLQKKIILPLLAILLFFVIIILLYQNLREELVSQINREQKMIAEYSAKSIETLFDFYEHNLKFITSSDSIKNMDSSQFKKVISGFYKSFDMDILTAVTLIDNRSKIVYTYPENPKVIGKDLSMQKHHHFMLKHRKPIVSDVFRAVQGYDTVVYLMPIFKGRKFVGSVAFLIPFKTIAEKYVKSISVRKTGYAWLISEKGVELYCPVPGHTGLGVQETSGEFPSVLKMAKRMMKGEEDATEYSYNFIRNKKVVTVRKYAYFVPVHLDNALWSLVVATPDSEVDEAINGYSFKLVAIMLLIVVVVVFYSSYILKTDIIIGKDRERKELEEKYWDLFYKSKESLAILNRKDGFIACNDSMMKMFLFESQDEFLGHDVLGLSPEFQTNGVLSKDRIPIQVDEAFQTDSLSFDWEHQRSNGDLFLAKVTLSISKAYLNNKDDLLVSIKDITEEKRKEEDLFQSQKMETIGVLAGGFAHDFNNVLGGITGSLSLINTKIERGKLTDKNLVDYLSIIDESASRAKEMVSQLLTLSRKQQFLFEVVNFVEVLQGVVDIATNSIDKIVSIKVVNPYEKIPISLDRSKIGQIILNLIINSEHAMTIMQSDKNKKGGVIGITIEKVSIEINSENIVVRSNTETESSFYWKISIKDTGVGMNSDTLEKIFDPFFTTKDKGVGTGLGLSMVYTILAEHNGTIEIDSKIGIGTNMSIFLPVVDELKLENSKKSSSIELHSGSGIILVIDDEKVIQIMAKDMLETYGYTVLIAHNGKEGIEIFKEQFANIKLVLLDLVMPDLDGESVYSQLVEIQKDVKVILSSGFKEDERSKRVINMGVDGFLQKPYTVEKLDNEIRKILHD